MMLLKGLWVAAPIVLSNQRNQSIDVYQQFELQIGMNHESEQCAICSQQPEDMLILSCAHNLCLDCATQLFSASSDSNSLQCEICLSTTPLDEDTVSCLKHLAAKVPLQAQQISPYPSLPKPSIKRNLWQCSQHNQQSLYYCLQCNDVRICSECILAKKHLNHKVMTIKKAGVFLMQKIEANNKQLEVSKNELKESQEYLFGLKQKMLNDQQEMRSNLKGMFETIMRNLDFRYKQLSTQLESLSKRSFQIVEGTLNHLRQKQELINLQLKSNKQAISSSSQQQIILKCIQLQHNKLNYQLNLPQLNMSHFSVPPLSLPYHQTIKDFDRIILKIKWNHENKTNKMPANDIFESAKTESVHNSNKQKDQIYQQVENFGQGWQNSMYKFSGIKGNSRRLEMSRSMDNATNIINKLQERIKR